jgi:hypothetical protein
MPPASINIQPPTNTKRLFRRLRIIRIRDGQLATQDQMRCEAGVLVWRVVRVSNVAAEREHQSTTCSVFVSEEGFGD